METMRAQPMLPEGFPSFVIIQHPLYSICIFSCVGEIEIDGFTSLGGVVGEGPWSASFGTPTISGDSIGAMLADEVKNGVDEPESRSVRGVIATALKGLARDLPLCRHRIYSPQRPDPCLLLLII